MGNTSPNPMVGAVIVSNDGKIIGEGYHMRYGDAHAEVNAIRSVIDQSRLSSSTLYVTLEPCSHYGKTPPCARLIIEKQIPRVVIGSVDPCDKVCGRGIAMLRNAGVEVVDGVLAEECRRLNIRFMTANIFRRPFVTLKWAQSADGYMDMDRPANDPPAAISTPLTRIAVHRLRSLHDAIMVGVGTIIADNPLLDTRFWGGRTPKSVILDRHNLLTDRYKIVSRNPIVIRGDNSIENILSGLYDSGITSVLVEGGAIVLKSFIDSGIWDMARVETSSDMFGHKGRVKSPVITGRVLSNRNVDGNNITVYSNNLMLEVKNL